MSGRFEPFAISDLEVIDVQPSHRAVAAKVLERPLIFQKLMVGPYSWTYWTAFGQAVACAGILPGGKAWAFLGSDMRRHMAVFVGGTRQALMAHPGPVYADIDSNSPQAVRWARILGFRPDGGQVWKFP